MSQAAYAKRRGVSQQAVWKRTVTAGGPVPVHGPKKLIDADEADGLWEPTMSAAGAANSRFRGKAARAAADPPPAGAGSQLAQARAAALVIDVQTKRLLLEQRRGALISRDRAVLKCFAFARLLRDAWLTWPARIGPQLAAAFDVDPTAFTVALESHVRQHLTDLAGERPEF
jgi:hypothetical protein